MTTALKKSPADSPQMRRRSHGGPRRTSKHLLGVDGRTVWARRRRDLIKTLTRTYGPDLTELETAQIEQAAAIMVRLEQLSIVVVKGEQRRSGDEEMVRLTRAAQRLLQGLGDRQRGNDGAKTTGEDVKTYLDRVAQGGDR
jgi:hypothetical protein